MQQLIESFLGSCKSEGKSKCTLQAYNLDLQEFSFFFKGKDISDIVYSDLILWSNKLESKGISASTRARKIASIKSFFKFLIKVGVIVNNPTQSLIAPKIEKKAPTVISSEEASTLLSIAKQCSTRYITSFRDYTILALFLYTGIRREELSTIMVSDIDFEAHTILINGKGNKQRYVYINNVFSPILSEYIQTYRILLSKAKSSPYLFPSLKSDKLSLGAINNIVNSFFNKINQKQYGVSAHILRKRFATSIFESTGDIALTSKLLGHSSPSVTMRYVVMDKSLMQKATNNIRF